MERDRALALWALNSVDVDDELADFPQEAREMCLQVQQESDPKDLDRSIIAARYEFLGR